MNTPNKLTLSRIFILTPFFLVFALIAHGLKTQGAFVWYGAILFFIWSGLFDFLDGNIARSQGSITIFGKQIDPIADKFTIVVALLVANWIGELPLWVTGVVVCRDYLVDGIRSIVISQKCEVVSASRLGKAKTFTQFLGLIILFIAASGVDKLLYPGQWIIYFSVFLAVVSMFDYFSKNWNILLYSLEEKEK